jgi:hypothetical protein
MGLTDGLTLALFSIAAVGLTIFAVIYWGKIYRRTFLNLLIRLLIILLCQVLALASIGLAVNRSNGFYSSWNDLLGTSSNFSQGATSAGSMAQITKEEISKAGKLASQSRLVRDVITGAQSQVSNVVYLDIPSAAVSQINKGVALDPKRYRVVEFLTGFPSQPLMWVKVLAIDHVLALYNQKHVGREIIGIFPEINIAGHYDLECMNLPGTQPEAETWLSTDMHSYLATRLGMADSRWGIMGVSTGGWCAAMLSVRHPNLYSAAVSIAGYYRPALPLTDPIALQIEMDKKYDFAASEAALTKKQPLYIVASLGDVYSIRETKKYLAKQHPNLAITYKEVASGGHNPRVWMPLIPAAISWLERNISV